MTQVEAADSYETRRRQASYRRRLAVLKAAGTTFAQHGYKNTPVEEIARNAGVSKGLVFHFFGSKQDLFRSVVEDCLDRWSALSEYRAAGADAHSLEELRRLFLASFEFVEENPVLLLISSEREGLPDSYRREFSKRNKRWRARIRQTLEQGMARSEIRDVDTQQASVVFHELQSAMLENTMFTGSAPRYDRPKIDLAIDIFLRGIEQTRRST
jgi:AcrR family transcriptional regulator